PAERDDQREQARTDDDARHPVDGGEVTQGLARDDVDHAEEEDVPDQQEAEPTGAVRQPVEDQPGEEPGGDRAAHEHGRLGTREAGQAAGRGRTSGGGGLRDRRHQASTPTPDRLRAMIAEATRLTPMVKANRTRPNAISGPVIDGP